MHILLTTPDKQGYRKMFSHTPEKILHLQKRVCRLLVVSLIECHSSGSVFIEWQGRIRGLASCTTIFPGHCPIPRCPTPFPLHFPLRPNVPVPHGGTQGLGVPTWPCLPPQPYPSGTGGSSVLGINTPAAASLTDPLLQSSSCSLLPLPFTNAGPLPICATLVMFPFTNREALSYLLGPQTPPFLEVSEHLLLVPLAW